MFISSRRRTGPFTTTSGVAGLVVDWMAWRLKMGSHRVHRQFLHRRHSPPGIDYPDFLRGSAAASADHAGNPLGCGGDDRKPIGEVVFVKPILDRVQALVGRAVKLPGQKLH